MTKERYNWIVSYTEKFRKKYVVKGGTDILVDTTRIYDFVDTQCNRTIDFNIKVRNGEVIICPKEKCDMYMLFADKVVYTTKVKITADDYWLAKEKDDNYTFIFDEMFQIDE